MAINNSYSKEDEVWVVTRKYVPVYEVFNASVAGIEVEVEDETTIRYDLVEIGESGLSPNLSHILEADIFATENEANTEANNRNA